MAACGPDCISLDQSVDLAEGIDRIGTGFAIQVCGCARHFALGNRLEVEGAGQQLCLFISSWMHPPYSSGTTHTFSIYSG